MAEWANWSGRQTSRPQQIVRAKSVDDMIEAVGFAAQTSLAVRAVGAAHSHSRVAATDGVLVNLDEWQGVTSIDTASSTATIRSGTRIFQVGEPLFEHGLALLNQGDIDRQSLAGATATGTHGTGPNLQNLSASVQAVELVTGSGEVVRCSSDVNSPLFELARHSLGAVGLISELTLKLRQAYRLHERLWKAEPATVMEHIDDLTGSTRHFEFFWMPQGDFCACKSLTETDAPVDDMPDNRRERVGWSHNIISSTRDELHTEMEYAIPAAAGPACFAEIRELIRTDFEDLQWPVEYRTLASDDLWISAASGRATVTISVHQDIALDDAPLFQACEAVFRRYDGRPHWGKQHYRSGSELAELYPKYKQWWQLRDEFDPQGVFLTPDLEALRP